MGLTVVERLSARATGLESRVLIFCFLAPVLFLTRVIGKKRIRIGFLRMGGAR